MTTAAAANTAMEPIVSRQFLHWLIENNKNELQRKRIKKKEKNTKKRKKERKKRKKKKIEVKP